jgi:PIN domain nuclease of toxin-antitoxin system
VEGTSEVKLLMDTHIWIWSLLEPSRLSRGVSKALADPANEVWASPISVWEILTLCQKGRLVLRLDAMAWVSAALLRVPLKEATFTHEVALANSRSSPTPSGPCGSFLGNQRQGLRTNACYERP